MNRWASLSLLLVFGCSGDEPGETSRDGGAGVACGAATQTEDRGAAHISEPDPITYVDSPPSSGNHRPQWAKWGEYSELGPERWLHNLEHGGAAFLYAPQDPDAVADALRSYTQARGPDDGGAFRYILAPYAGLSKPVAVITWGWTYLADDVCPGEIDAFLTTHYRRAPEDIASDGAFTDNWVQR